MQENAKQNIEQLCMFSVFDVFHNYSAHLKRTKNIQFQIICILLNFYPTTYQLQNIRRLQNNKWWILINYSKNFK